MTITRLFSCIALLAIVGALGWVGDVHAQQQPAAASSVAAPAKAQVAEPAGVAAQGHTKQASKTAAISHVQAIVAANTTAEVDKEQARYQSHPRGNMDPYRNAVTPPVDSGR
ncbi:hypothetical protein [Dyella amyloliquefaciens]|uniref:hypothetical protein n=1 Tax=Dyella amyloliquefaciens TaxID=1770545 RepID=UPI00102E284A|nr:hypothetical protein [Dyella amyloliquefaciens]